LNQKLDNIYLSKKENYSSLLSMHNPYFRSLGTEMQDRFLKRVIFFIEGRDFQFVDMEEDEKMRVVITASAIQLTFGLGHFMMDYFKTIYVLKNKYRYQQSVQAFEGNVGDEGIYLSWEDFEGEYRNYGDGQNVGLHEMAHALVYINFYTETPDDDAFKARFSDFSAVARPVFEAMQQGQTSFLDRYAATNYDEFWAVCVESFFERSFQFREQKPELYKAICDLLNQDPITKDKILLLPESGQA